MSFRIAAGEAPLTLWYDNDKSHVAFSRGDRAFIAFNHEDTDFNTEIKTSLPVGIYCDIISGARVGKQCTGAQVIVKEVDGENKAHVYIPANSPEGVIAVHVGSMSKLI